MMINVVNSGYSLFLNDVDINSGNNNGHTALHLALMPKDITYSDPNNQL